MIDIRTILIDLSNTKLKCSLERGLKIADSWRVAEIDINHCTIRLNRIHLDESYSTVIIIEGRGTERMRLRTIPFLFLYRAK